MNHSEVVEALPRCELVSRCDEAGDVPPHPIRCCAVCRAHYGPRVASLFASDELRERVLTALCALTCAVRSYGAQGVALSFNGGKDCTVILELLALMHPALVQQLAVVVHFRPRDVFAEVEDFLRQCQQRHGFTLWECACSDGGSRSRPIAVCLTKTLHAFPTVRAVLLGTRNSDFVEARQHHSSCFALSDVERGWPRVMRVSPIVDWQYDHVWGFLRALGSDTRHWCSLYDKGYTSLGAVSDTRPNPALFDAASQRYKAAWLLEDNDKERESRVPKFVVSPPAQGDEAASKTSSAQ